ncbi:MAG: hypothetical protein WCP14_01750 [bacterium]
MTKELETTKKIIDRRKMTVVVGITTVAVALVCGAVWYYMAQQENFSTEKTKKETVISKDSIIVTASVTPTTTISPSGTPSPTPTIKTNTNSAQALKAFCQENGGSSDATDGISYMETANGVYGICTMVNGKTLESTTFIAAEISGVWTKVWNGNGVIDLTTCNKYKIPNKMSGGACNY